MVKQYIGFFLIALFLMGCLSEKKQPVLQEGVVDIANWNFEADGTLFLDGEWELYWMKLLEPENFKSNPGINDKNSYLSIPGPWNKKRVGDVILTQNGYATLRIRLFNNSAKESLSLQIENVASAYKIWVNGKLLFENGKVGVEANDVIPKHHVNILSFAPENSTIEIVLQVSNFDFYQGGILNSILLGKGETLRDNRFLWFGIEMILNGGLLLMAIYHFGLYFLRRTDLSSLYFGVYCLLWLFINLISISRTGFVHTLFQDIPRDYLYRIENAIYCLTIPNIMMFFYELYPDEFSQKAVRLSQWLGGAFFTALILIPFYISAPYFLYYYIISVLFILYAVYALGLAKVRKKSDVTLIFAGFLILIMFSINDMLFDVQIIQTAYLSSFGFFFFIIAQSFVISARFSRALVHAEQLSEELEEKNRNLAQLDKLKDEFLSNTSHELRTPLHSITGLAESVMKGAAGRISDEVGKNLTMIISSGKRLTRLVNDILDFSRLKNQDIQLQLKSIDLFSLADLIVNIFKEANISKTIKICNQVPKNLSAVLADEDRLQQIFYNLIGNAVKFTKKGEINITAEMENTAVKICVSDTGIGISPEKQKLVFSPFTQIKTNVTGTGLGLGITKYLVELHKGTLQLQSQVGVGSHFSFTIPATSKKPIEEPTGIQPLIEQFQEFPDHLSIPPTKEPRYRVFVVDDEYTNLKVVANFLSLENIAVEFFSSGKAALNALKESKIPDLVLLDVMMPELSGHKVCHTIRKDYSAAELPIIMLTAKSQISDLIEGLQYGANDYLTKPFSGEELVARTLAQLKIKDSYWTLRENKVLKGELELRKETERNLRATEQKLSGFLNTLEEPILVVNEFNEICFYNHAFETDFPELQHPLLEQPLSVLLTEEDMVLWNRHEKVNSRIIESSQKFHPLSFKIKQMGSPKNRPNLFVASLEFEEELYFIFLIRYSSFSDKEVTFENSVLEAATAVSNNSNKLRVLEESFNGLTPDLLSKHPDFIKDLREVESGLNRLEGQLNINFGKIGLDEREIMVKMINLALDIWTKTTHKTKTDLAQETGFWKIYIDKDGYHRTQTLDKYLDLSTLPAYPRKKRILETVQFVLECCPEASEDRKILTKYAAEFL